MTYMISSGFLRSSSRFFDRILLVAALFSVAASRISAADAPFIYRSSMVIPNVPLWPYSDHMAIDLTERRLFATPQGAKALAVIDLKTGQVLKMIPGMGNPHSVIYTDTQKRLYVSEGTPGDVKVFNGENYSLIKTIPLAPGADGMDYDPKSNLIFVADGQGADTGHAYISVIDPVRMEKIADIPIATTDFEGMAIDAKRHLLYASLPDDSAVAVVDLRKRRVIDTWKVPSGGHAPFAIAMNSAGNRLYVACRNALRTTAMTGSLFVLKATNGDVMAKLPIGGWADGISVDNRRNRIYVSTGVGYIDTYAVLKSDIYRRLPRVPTALLGKTSIYSSALDRLYVSVPHVGDGPAQVLVFKPNP